MARIRQSSRKVRTDSCIGVVTPTASCSIAIISMSAGAAGPVPTGAPGQASVLFFNHGIVVALRFPLLAVRRVNISYSAFVKEQPVAGLAANAAHDNDNQTLQVARTQTYALWLKYIGSGCRGAVSNQLTAAPIRGYSPSMAAALVV